MFCFIYSKTIREPADWRSPSIKRSLTTKVPEIIFLTIVKLTCIKRSQSPIPNTSELLFGLSSRLFNCHPYHNSAIDKLCMAFISCSASFFFGTRSARNTGRFLFMMEISLYHHLCFVDIKLSDRFVKPVFYGQHAYSGDVNH